MPLRKHLICGIPEPAATGETKITCNAERGKSERFLQGVARIREWEERSSRRLTNDAAIATNPQL
jgi:hypothetical protein